MVTDETVTAHSSHLPRQQMALVGRATEAAQLRQQLLDPACRLLTLLGPGGMGKTRLAIEVATSLQDEFAAGVHFVNLQPLSDPTQLPTALADALHFPLSGSDPVERQLLGYLANKELLLLLDNFEHLLAGVDFLSELLLQSPGVKALVTSRELLNLQEEWLFPLTGLACPARSFDPQILEQYAAATLFVERMRRVRPQFVLAEEAVSVGRICRLVEGMPLALELAATWTKTLSCAEIANEVERGLDLLGTSLRNIPERHRSMAIVFAQSWRQLNKTEQSVFARLSVFRGGFRREAAEQVAGAAVTSLSGLVDKSLVRWEREEGGRGRYQVHELLRQFGEQQLSQQKQALDATWARHATYYAQLLHKQLPNLLGKGQLTACTEIRAELENIRVAWFWLVARRDSAALYQIAPVLAHFFQITSRFHEALEPLAHATQQLEQEPRSAQDEQALATLLALLGCCYIRLAQLGKARPLLTRSWQLHEEQQLQPAPGMQTDPRLGLGILALIDGDYAGAVRLGETLAEQAAHYQHSGNEQYAWDIAARGWAWQGEWEQARLGAQRSITLAEKEGEQWFKAYTLDLLGLIASQQRDDRAAQTHYTVSFALHEAFGDRDGMGRSLNYQGDHALRLGDIDAALSLYQRSFTIYQGFDYRSGMAEALTRLGHARLLQREYDQARQHLYQAVELALAQQLLQVAMLPVRHWGELYFQVGLLPESVTTFAFLLHHPGSDAPSRQFAEQRLREIKHRLDEHTLHAAYTSGQAMLWHDLLALFARPLSAPAAAQVTHPSAQSGGNAALIEPLTERELEILQLIAEGHTNHAIADKLFLSPGTVKWYSSEIYGKLGVANRTQAVAEARRLRLFEP